MSLKNSWRCIVFPFRFVVYTAKHSIHIKVIFFMDKPGLF